MTAYAQEIAKESEKGRDRRGEIVAALYRCMARKGFAASTLSDIAEEAGMSSSHLLYYFSGKEAIMEAFFKWVCRRVEEDLAKVPKDSPEDRIEAIANLFLSPKGYRKTDQAVILDLYGQSVQNKAMRRIKVAHDRRIKNVFIDLFETTPRTPDTSAEDAAQSAYATFLGLRGNSFYDPQLPAEQAHRLFRLTLYRLAGLKAQQTARTRSRSKSS